MKQLFVALTLVALLVSPVTQAQDQKSEGAFDPDRELRGVGGYGGLSYGQLDFYDSDAKTNNIGISLGGIAENGWGFEVLYSFSVVDYEFDGDTIDGNGQPVVDAEVDMDTDVIAAYVVFSSLTRPYVKVKLGYGFLSINVDGDDFDSVNETEEDFTFGATFGLPIGEKGAIELNYYELPEVDSYAGFDLDDSGARLINATFVYTF